MYGQNAPSSSLTKWTRVWLAQMFLNTCIRHQGNYATRCTIGQVLWRTTINSIHDNVINRPINDCCCRTPRTCFFFCFVLFCFVLFCFVLFCFFWFCFCFFFLPEFLFCFVLLFLFLFLFMFLFLFLFFFFFLPKSSLTYKNMPHNDLSLLDNVLNIHFFFPGMWKIN